MNKPKGSVRYGCEFVKIGDVDQTEAVKVLFCGGNVSSGTVSYERKKRRS